MKKIRGKRDKGKGKMQIAMFGARDIIGSTKKNYDN